MANAQKIVKAILRELEGRKGFDWWWEDIEVGVRDEIIADLEAVVKEKLK